MINQWTVKLIGKLIVNWKILVAALILLLKVKTPFYSLENHSVILFWQFCQAKNIDKKTWCNDNAI